MLTQTNLDQKEFLLKKPKELLELFTQNKNLTVKVKGEEISLSLSPGMAHGIDFGDVIVLRHAKSIPPPRHIPDEDWSVQVLFQRLMNPLEAKEAVEKFRLYNQNFAKGKKTVIPELTKQQLKLVMAAPLVR
jgi:hypothetical protein